LFLIIAILCICKKDKEEEENRRIEDAKIKEPKNVEIPIRLPTIRVP
jgi:hypothetical protein